MKKNNLIKDFISTLIFSYMVYTSLYELPNVNIYFFIFIVIGLIFFTVSLIYEGLRIYPKLKTKYQKREKLGLSKNFLWNYFIFLNGIFIISLSIWCAILIHPYFLLFIIIGIGYTYSRGKICMKNNVDLNKIESLKNKKVKQLLYRIES